MKYITGQLIADVALLMHLLTTDTRCPYCNRYREALHGNEGITVLVKASVVRNY